MKVQKVLDECPSDRIASFTTRDSNITAHNAEKRDEISDYQDSHWNAEFCVGVNACDANFDATLEFKHPVNQHQGIGTSIALCLW